MSDLSITRDALHRSTSQLPVASYFDAGLFQRERDTLFRHGPRYVGHALAVPERGDYHSLIQEGDGRALVRTADGLVESFRPGVMDRRGVGYETLSRINPRLVLCSITGYGQTGPYRNEPGHDLNYCALAGTSEQIGRAGDLPALSNVPIADLLGGSLTSLAGLLAALFDAGRTGRGRHVDIAMADSMLAHTLVPMVTLATHGQTRPAGTDKLSGGLPCYGLYRTQDGRQLAVGALERKFWDVFCDVVGRADLKSMHLPRDAATTESMRADVAELIGSQPLAHWVERFRGSECCVTPVLRLDEALDDPHFQARGMVVQSEGSRQFACRGAVDRDRRIPPRDRLARLSNAQRVAGARSRRHVVRPRLAAVGPQAASVRERTGDVLRRQHGLGDVDRRGRPRAADAARSCGFTSVHDHERLARSRFARRSE